LIQKNIFMLAHLSIKSSIALFLFFFSYIFRMTC
jgi:hypothetical protein